MLAWNARVTFEDYLDMVSIRGNVEDDILLSGGDCDAPKGGFFILPIYLCWTVDERCL